MELDIDGYVRLGRLRRDLDEWLRAELLMDHWITMLRFGEGYVEAECVVQPPRVVDGDVLKEWRRLPVSTLPPEPVLRAIVAAQYDGTNAAD